MSWRPKQRRSGGAGSAVFPLDFTSSMPGGIDMVSGPAGYATQADGTLALFSANTARRTTNGLLVENAGANYDWYSTSYAAGSSNGRLSGSATSSIGDSGSQTAPYTSAFASQYLEDTSSTPHGFTAFTRISVSNQGLNIYSCYAKPRGGREGIALFLSNAADSANVYVPFLLSASGSVGTVTKSNTGIFNPTIVNTSITALANGWYFCWFSFTTTETQVRAQIYSYNGAITGFAGDTTKGAFLWGWQMEFDSAQYASSQITTGGSLPVSRVMDNLTMRIDPGYNSMTFTFDDNSTQTIGLVGSPSGLINFPNGLTRPQVKAISASASAAGAGSAQYGNQQFAFDPAQTRSNITLSNNNRTIAGPIGSGSGTSRGTVGKSSGLWYWEIDCPTGGNNDDTWLGVCDGTTALSALNNSLGGFANSGAICFNAAGTIVNGMTTVTNLSMQNQKSNTSRYMFALDATNGKVWFGSDGRWFTGGDPANGLRPWLTFVTGGTWYPAASVNMFSNTRTIRIPDATRYASPVGFSMLA